MMQIIGLVLATIMFCHIPEESVDEDVRSAARAVLRKHILSFAAMKAFGDELGRWLSLVVHFNRTWALTHGLPELVTFRVSYQ